MSGDYRKLVAGYDMVQSVGGTAVCRDCGDRSSVVIAAMWGLVHRYRFATQREPSDLRLDQPLQLTPALHPRLHRHIAWEQQYHQPKANQAA